MPTPRPFIRAFRLALLLPGAVQVFAGCGETTSPEPAGNQVAAIALATPPPEFAYRNIALTAQPVVELRSAGGERVRQEGVEILATVSAGTLKGTTSVMTNAEGRAEFTDLVVDAQGGSVVLRFSCCDVAPSEHSLAIYLGEAGNSLGPRSPQQVQARAGTMLTPGPSVQLTSEFWMPVEGAVVRFTLHGPGTIPVAEVVTNAEGIAQLPSYLFYKRPGTTLLSASVESGQRVTFTMKATAEGEVGLVHDGTALIGEPGGEFVAPPMRVTYGGVPQSGVSVEFLRSGGSDGPVTVVAVTDASGMTPPVALPLSPEQGVNVYEAWAIGYSALPTVLEIVGSPGAPFNLVSSAPVDLSAENPDGRTFVTVRLENSVGEPVNGASIRMSEIGDAGTIEWVHWFGGYFSADVAVVTEDFGSVTASWRVPSTPGTYRIEFVSPWAATPLILTAVRE